MGEYPLVFIKNNQAHKTLKCIVFYAVKNLTKVKIRHFRVAIINDRKKQTNIGTMTKKHCQKSKLMAYLLRLRIVLIYSIKLLNLAVLANVSASFTICANNRSMVGLPAAGAVPECIAENT